MLHLTRIRKLDLSTSASCGRPAYLSAASGLVCAGRHLYVVADDELQLGVFLQDEDQPGSLLRLLPGELPDPLKKRKKRKPDFEVLTCLPSFDGYAHGALLALGSGSTARRCRGVLLKLNAQGEVQGTPHELNVTHWYAPLLKKFDDLNLEGAWVSGNDFCLLQRGNKGDSPNAVLRYHLVEVLAALSQRALPSLHAHAIQEMHLGHIDKVPLCFSDACGLPEGGWLFTAVAEDADSAYADGKFLGAAVGRVDAKHQLQWIKQVSPSFKIEGIAVQPNTPGLKIWLVSDADDVSVPAYLFSAELD